MSQVLMIRACVRDDLPALMAIYRQLVPDDVPLLPDVAAERFEAMLDCDGMTVLGGFAGAALASTCTLVVIPNLTRGGASYALIENVVTDSAFRRKGHGRAVIDKAISLAFDAGCYKVMLLTGARNPGTLEFYRDCGFSQTKHGMEVRRLLPQT